MRKALIAASALALALTVGACGDDEKGGTGENNGAPASNSGLFQDAQGLVDAATQSTSSKKSAKFTLEGSAAGQTINGEGAGEFAGKDTKMQMTMTAMGMSFEMRQIGTVAYVKMPSGLPGADPSKPWMMLQYLVEAGGEIKSSEQTELDGQQANHYTVEVDTAKMMEKMGGTAATGGQIPSGMEKMTIELWLSADNLPMQVKMQMGSLGDFTMKYTDWGTPVSVEEPPADEVGEMPTGGGVPGASTAPVPTP
jgi:hypothetical protein